MPQGLERIGLHLPSLLAYTINFILLLAFLYLVAYRPFLRLLAERVERIQRGLADAEAAALARAEAVKTGQIDIEAAREEARRIKEEANRRAQEEIEEGKLKGRREAKAYLDQARQRADIEDRKSVV